jgi:hypothetical protein
LALLQYEWAGTKAMQIQGRQAADNAATDHRNTFAITLFYFCHCSPLLIACGIQLASPPCAAMHASNQTAMQLSQAYQHCLAIAQQHYENFPTASKLLRSDLRPAVAAIYAFARHADDLADEGDAEAETRLKQINAWETLLE